MFNKKTIKDIKFRAGTRVVLRADFNVPLDENLKVLDDYRIQKALPTIKYLTDKGCKVVILSHLGRPDGKVDPSYSLAPVARLLEQQLASPFEFIDDTLGEKAKQAADQIVDGGVLLLENVRFDPREESNDQEYAKQLASYGELFIQDGFGVVHRAHASTEAITHELPSVAGLLLAEEVDSITKAMNDPKRPMLAIIGGAKISDKLEMVKKFIDIADMVAIGGAMANTFLKAKGVKVGKSLVEEEGLGLAEEILELAEAKTKKNGFSFYLPEDAIVSTATDGTASLRIVDWSAGAVADTLDYPKQPEVNAYEVQPEESILDVGPQTASYIAGMSRGAATVIWNGTLGLTETRPKRGTVGPFEFGSHRILTAIDKNSAPSGQTSIVGGGDTASYVLNVNGVGLPDHVSTGGGASLELMSGKKLPGIEALQDN